MRSLWVPGWVQQRLRLHHLHVGQRQRGGLQPGSDAGTRLEMEFGSFTSAGA